MKQKKTVDKIMSKGSEGLDIYKLVAEESELLPPLSVRRWVILYRTRKHKQTVSIHLLRLPHYFS